MSRRQPHVSQQEQQAQLAQFQAFDRAAFQQQLARAVNTHPTEAQLRKLASKSPRAHADYTATYAKLSGYTDKTESVHTHIIADLAALSDSQLQERLAGMQAELAAPALQLEQHTDTQITDAQYTDITHTEAQPAEAQRTDAQHTDNTVSTHTNRAVHRASAAKAAKAAKLARIKKRKLTPRTPRGGRV